MKKRILSIVLALALTIGILVPTLSAPASAANTQRYTDVSPDDWYYEAVNAMAEAGIVSGIGDGRFEPNRSMTAGELATVLWNMMYGDWCKGTELYQTYTNGYGYGLNDYTKASHDGPSLENWSVTYDGPSYGNWGTPAIQEGRFAFSLRPTTWDGSVSLMIYGDSRLDPIVANKPTSPVHIGYTVLGGAFGRLAGKPYGTNASFSDLQDDDKYYGRDMSGLAIVAMSGEYVTRGFAISELVNVLRQTGNLKSVYNASTVKNNYPTGASIPDWADITNVYHDICSAASVKNSSSLINSDGKYLFHDYTYAWDYIDEPGKTVISGGYANTWFSADILLAYQAGIVSGVDSTGQCGVGRYMTRAEVCQMLYNAGVTKLKPQNSANGGVAMNFRFIRDNKVYVCRPVAIPTIKPYIEYCGNYNPSSNDAANGLPIYVVYDTDVRHLVDIRQQEWPTHPEFWGN